MLLLVKCYENKIVKSPGFSSIGKPSCGEPTTTKKDLKIQQTIVRVRIITMKILGCKRHEVSSNPPQDIQARIAQLVAHRLGTGEVWVQVPANEF